MQQKTKKLTVITAITMSEKLQRAICQKYHSELLPPEIGSMVGISRDLFEGNQPINGLRHRPEGRGNGWFFWIGGEMSSDADFFQPMHVEHLYERLPEVTKYLALKPGFRIQINRDGYEDVWFDEKLLEK